MIIEFINEIWDYENDISIVDEIIERVSRGLHSDILIDYMVVDSVEVREQYKDYILNHIDGIKNIKVVTISVKDYKDGLLLTANDYLERACPEISPLATRFYQNVDDVTWDLFGQLIEGTQWIIEMLYEMNTGNNVYKTQHNLIHLYESLRIQLEEMSNAIENSDFSLVADLLEYEVKTTLIAIKEEVVQILDNEVVRHDLN